MVAPYSIQTTIICCIISSYLLSGCATQQGRQGANIGALTGATAGALLDSDNPWRGAVIGGSMGAVFGGALTDQPSYYGYQNTPVNNAPPNYYNQQYYYPPPPQYSSSSRSGYNTTTRGAAIGGITGAAAGAMLDDDNSWRGGLIGGALGSFFGGSIGFINSSPNIPIRQP